MKSIHKILLALGWILLLQNVVCRQCDQTLDWKSCPNVSKSCLNNIHSSFYINWSFFLKNSTKVSNLFGLLLWICCQELSKIAQSGHTVCDKKLVIIFSALVCRSNTNCNFHSDFHFYKTCFAFCAFCQGSLESIKKFDQSLSLFVYFRPFQNSVTNFNEINWEREDAVLGIRNQSQFRPLFGFFVLFKIQYQF